LPAGRGARWSRGWTECTAEGNLRGFRPVDYKSSGRKPDAWRTMRSSVATQSGYHPFVPPPVPRTPKSAETRKRLLDVGAHLFIERGYSAVSMRDIAAAAELTKGAVYGHFRSKGQLLVETVRWKIAERDHSPEFRDAVANPVTGVVLMYDETGRETRLLEV